MKSNWPTNPSSRAKLTTGHRKLGEVCELNMGQSPASSTYNEEKIGLPFYQGKKDYGEKYPTPRVWCSDPIKIVEAGDILISVRAPVGALNIAKEKSCIGRGLTGLRGKASLDQDYLFHFLKLKEKEIADLGTGSTFTAISKKHLENIEIPLPPLSEQKKIVAKLERVLEKISEAKKLRAEARENADNLLPAELHKIFSQQHSNILQNVGMSSSGKKSWEEKELGEIFVLNYGKGLSRLERSENGKYIVYGANGELGRSDKHLIEGNGLIIGRKGSAGEITRASGRYWPTDVTYFVTEDKKYDIGFAYYLFKFLNFPQYAVGVKPGINRNQIYEIKIPFPPLTEQKKIVVRLDSLSQKIQKLQKYQKTTQSDFLTLEQSVLSKAFSAK